MRSSDYTTVPEPSHAVLLGIAGAALVRRGLARRRT
jgi:hypothetical protein